MKRLAAIVPVCVFATAISLAQPKELQVVVAAPRGGTTATSQSQAIVVTFNQPMVPLQAVSTQDGSAIMKILPAIRGKYRWMGTTTLAFVPAENLPTATHFVVTVPAGTRSLSGQALASAYEWDFETPRPRVTRTDPYMNQKYVELDHAVLLQFNQQVDPQTVSKFISIIEQTKGAEPAYPSFTAQHPSPRKEVSTWRPPVKEDTTTELLLTPAQPFRRGAAVTVLCRAGLPGTAGPLGMEADYTLAFSTYNDLAFTGIRSDYSFDPGSPIRFLFSNPVPVNELATHLSFDPAVVIPQEILDNTYATDDIWLTLPLKAETAYHGVVKAGLKDRFGNTLASDAPFTFTTIAFKPYVRMTTGPGILEAYESHKYPVFFMNKDSVGVQMGKVNPDRIVQLMQHLDFSYGYKMMMEEGVLLWPEGQSEAAKEFTRSTTWRIKAPRNTRTVKPLDLDAVLGTSKTGVVFAQVDNLLSGDNRRYLKTIVQVTNMGITAKFSPEANLIWVTSLKDASPVPGASVEIRNDSNQVVWKGTTDDQGLVRSPGWGKLSMPAAETPQSGEGDENADEGEYAWYSGRQPVQWVIVRLGEDIAFTNSTWNNGIEPWAFGIEQDYAPKAEKIEAELFTDRGLYKASEQVEIKGIVRVRSEGAWHVARNTKLEFVVMNSRNEEVLKSSPKLSPFGSFALSVPLKPSAPLGSYRMVLRNVTGSGKSRKTSPVAWGSFRVEAFRAAEFEVTGKTGNPEYTVGDTVTGFLSARYLFGAPLKSEPVTWRVSVSGTGWQPKGYDGYYFGPIGWLTRYSRGFGYRLLASDQATLDAYGSIMIRTPLRVGEITGTVSFMLEGDVTSPTRQQISGRATVVVHGGEYYIGLKPSTTFLQTDSLLTCSLITVTPDGKPVPSQEITLKVYQRIWHSVRKAETGGRYSWVSEEADTLADSSVVTTTAEPVVRSFTPKHAGFYYIQAEGKDRRGNQLLSQAYFYVSGSGYVAWERSNDDRIELIASKDHFDPGDIAHLIVKSPYESAPALVSLEREGILRHFATKLVGSAPQIDIPITSEMLPNVFVSVVLLQGRVARPGSSPEGDIGRPSFKVGYVKLSVSPKDRALNVELKTKDDYKPGDTVELALNVMTRQGRGAAAEVALSVADLGVLNLINYRLPNPFELFYRERGLAVTTTETRMHLVEQREYGEKGEDEGGGGMDLAARSAEMNAEGIRKDFRASAYWNPAIRTDSNGQATVRFKLPDNLTGFRAMAVAHTVESDFGYGDASFTVSKQLLLQPSLPRFARVGDTFESGVVIINHSSSEKSVTLIASARGIVMRGKDTTVHVLKPGQATEVRYSFVAEKIGKATLTFRARTDEDSDGLQWSIPVNAPRLRESVALYESTTDEHASEAVVAPDSIYPDIGGVEFTMASTAMVGLSGGISYLFEYPYGCLEQRCSSVLPMILAKDLVEAFRFDVLKGKDYRQVVMKILDELPLFQRENGGFSYWKNTPDTWPYVSAYALYTMVQAKRNGYAVDAKSLQGGLEYLKNVLSGKEKGTNYSDLASTCTRALILYTLALNGTPDHGYMESLYKERGKAPLFAKAYLLRALHAAQGNATMQAELVRDFTNRAKVAPTSVHFEEPDERALVWCYSSAARTTALVMQALIETQPENTLIPKGVRWLLDQQKSGRWRTTQENLYVVDALATYFKTYEKDEPRFRATIALAGKNILHEAFEGRSMKTASADVPMASLNRGAQTPVGIEKTGPGRLYYGVRMNYYPLGETVAKEEGLQVSKSFDVQDTAHDPRSPFAVGTVVKITLAVVTNQDRNFVVVDDAVPAGFEIVNTSFQTTARNLESDQQSQEWVFQHAEKYDDHVLLFADYMTAGLHEFSYLARVTRAGTYRMPATRAEGMYEPEVFGQTGSSEVVIR